MKAGYEGGGDMSMHWSCQNCLGNFGVLSPDVSLPEPVGQEVREFVT